MVDGRLTTLNKFFFYNNKDESLIQKWQITLGYKPCFFFFFAILVLFCVEIANLASSRMKCQKCHYRHANMRHVTPVTPHWSVARHRPAATLVCRTPIAWHRPAAPALPAPYTCLMRMNSCIQCMNSINYPISRGFFFSSVTQWACWIPCRTVEARGDPLRPHLFLFLRPNPNN